MRHACQAGGQEPNPDWEVVLWLLQLSPGLRSETAAAESGVTVATKMEQVEHGNWDQSTRGFCLQAGAREPRAFRDHDPFSELDPGRSAKDHRGRDSESISGQRIRRRQAVDSRYLQVTVENVYDASPAERWAYFLQNADQLTPAEIRRLFPDQEFSEAAGVLEMISRTPEQLMAYNARLKFQRDEVARILQARLEGREEGRQEGEEIGEARGRIAILQELLGQRVWTAEDFAKCDAAQLNAVADQLQQQLRARNS